MSEANTSALPRDSQDDPVGKLRQRWHQGDPPALADLLAGVCSLPPTQIVDVLRVDQQFRWQRGHPIPAEIYLESCPELMTDPANALVLIYGEIWLKHQRGEPATLTAYQERFPALAEWLHLQFEVHQALLDDSNHTTGIVSIAATERHGLPVMPGYDIEDELGRGGMGVVYRARHKQLDRMVALKMVRDGRLAEPAVLLRFQGEARAIAQLRHEHIIQVFEVGEFEAMPYFAMEYVDGGNLSAFQAGKPLAPLPAAVLLEKLVQAVAHAHSCGIIHRDLKPANVLMTAEGQPKITDFGLAKHFQQDQGLTETGAAMGTPNYMPPEQAEGRKDVGPAADLYTLGAILYELITGRPPFLGTTPLETLFMVMEQEPLPPRLLNRQVPRDLETICLKCLQKQPTRRYASALTLADDLRRFVESRPILARPVNRLEKTWRWCRRNPALTGLLTTLLAAVVLGGGLAVWLDRQQLARRAETTQVVTNTLQEAVILGNAAKKSPSVDLQPWKEALAAVHKAEELLNAAAPDEKLRQHVQEVAGQLQHEYQEAELDFQVHQELKTIRANRGEIWWDNSRQNQTTDQAYAQAFRRYQVDVDSGEPSEAAARLNGRAIRAEIVAALDDWWIVRRTLVHSPEVLRKNRNTFGLLLMQNHLLGVTGNARYLQTISNYTWHGPLRVARRLDPDPWRDRLRLAAWYGDRPAIRQLALTPEAANQPTATVIQVALLLKPWIAALETQWRKEPVSDPQEASRMGIQEAIAYLRRAHRSRPNDYWINYELAVLYLWHLKPAQTDEAIRFLTAALAVQNDSHDVHMHLTLAFNKKAAWDEALASAQDYFRLRPNDGYSYMLLGSAYLNKEMWSEAVQALRQAVRLDADSLNAQHFLAIAECNQGNLDAAAAACRAALRLNPLYVPVKRCWIDVQARKGGLNACITDYRSQLERRPSDTIMRTDLAYALLSNGDLDAAIAELREVRRANPKWAEAHSLLGDAQFRQGNWEAARLAFKEYLRLQPNDLDVLVKLGRTLDRQRAFPAAINTFREVIRLQPHNHLAHHYLGKVWKQRGELEAALAEFQEAIRLRPDYPDAYHELAQGLWLKGARAEALLVYQKAIPIYRQSLKRQSERAETHLQLGWALQETGQFPEAVASFQQACKLGTKNDPEWLASAERHLRDAELHARLQRELSGTVIGPANWTNRQDTLEAARHCAHYQRQYALASAWFELAFAGESKWGDHVRGGHVHEAACAAALASRAAGEGAVQLDASARAHWRKQALTWLRIELDYWTKPANGDAAPDPYMARSRLALWKLDLSLKNVREHAELYKLSLAEVTAWMGFWRDVDQALEASSRPVK